MAVLRWLGWIGLAALTALLVPSALPVEAAGFTGYGICMGLGVLAALALTEARPGGRRAVLPAALAWLGAVLGGHLCWCLVSLDTLPYYEAGIALIWQPWLGGYTLFGALLCGGLGLALGSRRAREAFTRRLAACVPGLCLLIAAGRCAEYFTGQGIGSEVSLPLLQRLPFAVCTWADADYSEWHWAVWAGEALTALWLMAAALRRPLPPAREVRRFLAGLCASQIFWEQLRQDDYLRFGFVRFSQLCAVAVLLALLLLRLRRAADRRALLPEALLLLLAAGEIILAEFALDKPLLLPWTQVCLLLACCAALWLTARAPLSAAKKAARCALQAGAALALEAGLLLGTDWENPLILLSIGLSCVWLYRAAVGARAAD